MKGAGSAGGRETEGAGNEVLCASCIGVYPGSLTLVPAPLVRAFTGARISFVFHEIFANGIRELDPFDQVTDADIRTILYNASVRARGERHGRGHARGKRRGRGHTRGKRSGTGFG